MYGIQGTGNGHISRSLIIIEELAKHLGIDQIDLLISGSNYSLTIPYQVKYHFEGLSFTYGAKGKISYFSSIRNLHLRKFKADIASIDFSSYKLIITDQEPITAWGAKKNEVPSLGIGNIYALENTSIRRLLVYKYMTKLFQKLYCPVKNKLVFDFDKPNADTYYPILSADMKKCRIKDHHFTLVYLLSYTLSDIIAVLSNQQLAEFTFVVYTKEVSTPIQHQNLYLKPIAKNSFMKDLTNCSNVISTAGFQTIAEALFSKKNVLLIPIQGQPEQKANALLLKKYQVSSIRKLQVKKIHNWLTKQGKSSIQLQDDTEVIITRILGYLM